MLNDLQPPTPTIIKDKENEAPDNQEDRNVFISTASTSKWKLDYSTESNPAKAARQVCVSTCSECFLEKFKYFFMQSLLKSHNNAALVCQVCMSKFKSMYWFKLHSQKCSVGPESVIFHK